MAQHRVMAQRRVIAQRRVMAQRLEGSRFIMWLLYPVAAGGSRKRPLVRRRPSVSEDSAGRPARIQNAMGDSNSGVALGSRLLDTYRAANR